MKKNTKKTLTATLLALCVALVFTGTAFAESESMTATSSEETIPVYGYLSEDTYVVEPEEPTTGEIYVEVPTKVIFAAFESDGGQISSPKFAITNLSDKNYVTVEVAACSQQPNPEVDLDGKLALKLVAVGGSDLVSDLFPADYSAPKTLAERIPSYVEGSDSNKIEFTVGGTWSGGFAENLQPAFEMTLKFSAHD